MAIRAYRLTSADLVHHTPRHPQSIGDTGLDPSLIRDLILRTLFISGGCTGMDLCRRLCLPFSAVLDEILEVFVRDKLVVFQGGGAFGRATYEYLLTEKGRELAREAMERCSYVGPAPVPLEQYAKVINAQNHELPRVGKSDLLGIFDDLVLEDGLLERLGPAVNSMRSLFLYGPPGNGKTSIAERLARLLPGEIFVPHALSVENQIIQFFDPIVHHEIHPLEDYEIALYEQEEEVLILDDDSMIEAKTQELVLSDVARDEKKVVRFPSMDDRWVLCHRPVIMTGGELGLESLDLAWDGGTRTYQAPFQLRACQGMLLIDDFGRQKVHPRDLLNRWIVPLEKGIDYLTLKTGGKFEVPFNLLVVFSTNLDPSRLVDQAFLRRIRYKVEIKAPDEASYRAIFKAEAQRHHIAYNEKAVDHILATYYHNAGREPRCCHPRDILQLIRDIAKFLNIKPVLHPQLVKQACDSYFVHMEGDDIGDSVPI